MRRPATYVGGRGDLVVVLDCSDLERSATFWTQVLGYVRQGPAEGPYQALQPADGDGVELLLQRVPEAKVHKNRLHLDLRTRDLDGEVEKILCLGGRKLTEEPVIEEGWAWHILADPDGNELCVLRPSPDYWDP